MGFSVDASKGNETRVMPHSQSGDYWVEELFEGRLSLGLTLEAGCSGLDIKELPSGKEAKVATPKSRAYLLELGR